MTTLSVDIETYSSIDLIKSGVYAYVEAPDFEILLFGYAFDDEPVRVIDLLDFEDISADVMAALTNPAIIKTAFNANFERVCIAKHFKLPMLPEQWRCTSVHALMLGLPGNLDGVAKCLNLNVQKDAAGKALIKYFTVPCKPTQVNGGRTRNLPGHDPVKWARFISYCGTDVEVERAMRSKLIKFSIPEFEQRLWELDQRINDHGVRVDGFFVSHATTCDKRYQKKLESEAIALTGLDNPNSVAQLKAWLFSEEGVEVESLNKETVPKMLEQTDSDTVRRVLELRQEMAKTSITKYQAMKRGLGIGDRVRGLLQFYGANRTGRWAGRLVQVQNLPKNVLPDLALARGLLRRGEYELIEMLFDSVPSVLSQLIRTAFIPSHGCRFIVADFSAIEARVIAWLAGEKWRMDVFNGHGKIYEASAAQMFKVPLASITKGNPLRAKGKIAELALGFQGGVNALIKMGALDQGLTEGELKPLVDAWRFANPAIKRFWYDVERAAITAVKEKRSVKLQHGLVFSYESGGLFITLPSGRRLAYVKPRIEPEPKFDKDGITYEGIEQGRWCRLKTYGGKLVENIVQAVARDCLAEAMMRLDFLGYRIVMHIHDEVVIDEPLEHDAMANIVRVMGLPIDWAPGLPLQADAFETEFYRKED